MKKCILLTAVLTTLILVSGFFCYGKEGDTDTNTQPSEKKDRKKPSFVFLDPQKLVKVHIKNKWVEIPAVSHISAGIIELALGSTTAPNCRSHESMFITRAKPSLVHAGLQIIGLKPGKPVKFDGQSKLPTGDGVYIYVVWKDKIKDKEEIKYSRLENFIYNHLVREPVTDIKWIFTGSQLAKIKLHPPEKGENQNAKKEAEKKPEMRVVYEADIDGTIIATWHWSLTVIDIPLPEGSNDEAFTAYRKNTPKRETPVRFVFSPVKISKETIIKEFASQTFVLPKEKEKEKEKEIKSKDKDDIFEE